MEIEERLDSYIESIVNEIKLYKDYTSDYLLKLLKELGEVLEICTSELIEKTCNSLLARVDKSKVYTTIFIYSFIIWFRKKPKDLENLIKYIMDSSDLSTNTCYYLYYQIKSLIFVIPELDTIENKCLMWKFLHRCLDLFEDEIGEQISSIPMEKRDSNMAIVITGQMLSDGHGPTKTAKDRCYTLVKKMNKKLILINTAEVMSNVGEIPFWMEKCGNYLPELTDRDSLEWRECRIPYLQCDQRMPDIDTIKYLLEVIRKLKPSIVVSIGGSNILAGLVNKMVPALTVGLTTSGIEMSLTDYQILQSLHSKEDFNMMARLGIDKKSFIEGKFTFSLKEQKENISREELGIGKDDFVLVVVGLRLDYEITDEFLNMLDNLQDISAKIMILGVFDRNEKLKEKISWYSKNVLYLGECEDVLSRLELCDLYINPTRKGGGTSCVEAMYKGVPVITTDYGDVAGIVGEDFICMDYNEMESIVRRYYSDKEFYSVKSQKARKIAEENLDSEQEFSRCINEYLRRMEER